MRFLTVLAILVSFALPAPLHARSAEANPPKIVMPRVSPPVTIFSPREMKGDHGIGNPDASVTVIQYGSVACPICARVNEKFLPAFKAKYVDTGKVRYIFRPMLTGNIPVAAAGHRLAECAGKDKYFEVIDAIMRRQKEMDQGGPVEQYVNARPVLLDIARSVGLSEDQFHACIQDKEGSEALEDANDHALQAGINATPTFFINGEKLMLHTGDVGDFEKDFDAAIQPLLK